MLKIHVAQGFRHLGEGQRTNPAPEAISRMLFSHMYLQILQVDELVAEAALPLLLRSAGGSPGRGSAAVLGGDVLRPQRHLREAEHLVAGAALALETVVGGGVHLRVRLAVLAEHGLRRVAVPGLGAVLAAQAPKKLYQLYQNL